MMYSGGSNGNIGKKRVNPITPNIYKMVKHIKIPAIFAPTFLQCVRLYFEHKEFEE